MWTALCLRMAAEGHAPTAPSPLPIAPADWYAAQAGLVWLALPLWAMPVLWAARWASKEWSWRQTAAAFLPWWGGALCVALGIELLAFTVGGKTGLRTALPGVAVWALFAPPALVAWRLVSDAGVPRLRAIGSAWGGYLLGAALSSPFLR